METTKTNPPTGKDGKSNPSQYTYANRRTHARTHILSHSVTIRPGFHAWEGLLSVRPAQLLAPSVKVLERFPSFYTLPHSHITEDRQINLEVQTEADRALLLAQMAAVQGGTGQSGARKVPPTRAGRDGGGARPENESPRRQRRETQTVTSPPHNPTPPLSDIRRGPAVDKRDHGL